MAKHAIGKKQVGGKHGAANRGSKKGQGALKAGSAFKSSKAAARPGRTTPGGEKRVKTAGSHMRTESTIKRLQMYNNKPNRAKMKEQALKPMRIQPDRRWFGNTRVIAQNKMQAFRETIAKGVEDPYSVVLKSSKLPMSLLRETEGKANRMDLLSIAPYKETFGKGRQQKRVKTGVNDLEELLQAVDKKAEDYASGNKDQKSVVDAEGFEREAPADATKGHIGEEIFNKGTSKRIWAELYKVVDCSDVIVFVLDARDPQGTRCLQLERELRKSRSHKHIILLMNKVDLVPTWVSRRWIQELMRDFPTLAFHASITNPFGKNALLNLLRQFGNLLKEKKHITVGMIGYPNVGKSSVINALKHKKVCKAAPVPGETRIWQYIALTKKIYLCDCPGIVPPTVSDFNADCAKVLKGVVRAERLKSPSDYIDEVLTRVKKPYLLQRYKLPLDTTWEDSEEFLTILGKKMGKLLKGGEAALDTAARIVLYDWQRGRIPYFTPPPEDEVEEAAPADGEKKEGDVDLSEIKKDIGSLGEITCAHVFDEEDRRGEKAPDPAAVAAAEAAQSSSSSSSGAKASSSSSGSAPISATGSQKRSAENEDQPTKKKKKARRGGGGSGNKDGRDGAPGAPGGPKGAVLQQGSVDWKAMVAEFGV
eukprot:TRINITY_DN5412_c0_g1_i6.p1 TRINITY_DN5412_c0_g1~~TRINITY_DN5412_c0_g1_i6.p1  ORF type:complete len:649 (+),score=193.15 TRINITY_DN5412_c0_g1_i6:148-2094(+)